MKNRPSVIALLLPLFSLVQCGYGLGDSGPVTPQSEYTAENPGEWAGLEGAHLPIVSVAEFGYEKKRVTITVADSRLFNSRHYIEKIGVFDENKRDLAVKEFNQADIVNDGVKEWKAEFTLDSLPENPKIKAFVKCNLHDLWTTPLFPENRR